MLATPNQSPFINQPDQRPVVLPPVGPYRLDKMLGKGQTGLVRLGIDMKTNRKVAIKIINREKLTDIVLSKIEREITIMKLIEHPHVLQLYDVYENKKYLFLIMEYVSNGDLFEYLLEHTRLTPDIAKRFFKQIISALDFCHSHLICHRDLKPENLLLDENLNIKIADFGMASLQVDGSMLETSCGSPHYACPEVIKGEKYDGRKADVWSCGVILYALLVGALPFDHDILKELLEKIKKGTFQIPSYVPTQCQELIRSMMEIDPNKRITLQEIKKHPWMIANTENGLQVELPVYQVVQTAIIPSVDQIDTDVLANMTSLGCFKDKDKLISYLLNDRHNIEKVIYFLLLDRKLRNPANEGLDKIVQQQQQNKSDIPRKRIDRFETSKVQYDQLTVGSPAIGRRGITIKNNARYKSCHNTPLQSPCASPNPVHKQAVQSSLEKDRNTMLNTSQNSLNTLINKKTGNGNGGMNLIKKFQESHFQRRKLFPENSAKLGVQDTPPLPSQQQHQQHLTPNMQHGHSTTPIMTTPTQTHSSASPFLNTKSWFQQWTLRQDNTYQDKEFSFLTNDSSINHVKANLIRAFISIKDLNHSICNQTVFRCEYRVSDKLLARNIKFKVEIFAEVQHKQFQTYKVHFMHISGSTRVFNDLSQNICQLISTYRYAATVPPPPPATTQTQPMPTITITQPNQTPPNPYTMQHVSRLPPQPQQQQQQSQQYHFMRPNLSYKTPVEDSQMQYMHYQFKQMPASYEIHTIIQNQNQSPHCVSVTPQQQAMTSPSNTSSSSSGSSASISSMGKAAAGIQGMPTTPVSNLAITIPK